MTYMQGFIIPVPEAKKAAYHQMAKDSVQLFTDYGAQRIVETWGNQISRGDATDMYRAVNGEDGENIVFSWINWESKEAFDKAHEKMGSDERMEQAPPEMPFDGARMIYTGFDLLGEAGKGGKTGYVQGYVAPVPKTKREAFAAMSATMRDIAIESGALRAADGLAEDIADGKVTDFKKAVQATSDEAVAFGFVEWASKEAFEQGSIKMRENKKMPGPGSDMPLDGKRLIFGGFEVLLTTD